MMSFMIALVRYFEEEVVVNKAGVFFTQEENENNTFREMGNCRIFQVDLSEDAVEKLKHDHGTRNPEEAIELYINHQRGHGGSVQAWQTEGFRKYVCHEVKMLETVEIY